MKWKNPRKVVGRWERIPQRIPAGHDIAGSIGKRELVHIYPVESDICMIRSCLGAAKHLGIQIHGIDSPARIPKREKTADVPSPAGKIEAGERAAVCRVIWQSRQHDLFPSPIASERKQARDHVIADGYYREYFAGVVQLAARRRKIEVLQSIAEPGAEERCEGRRAPPERSEEST